jgi:hypothetical protein
MPNGYVSPAADFGQVGEDKDGGNLAPAGRAMEILSEHTVEGWLEGYLSSGRHSVYAYTTSQTSKDGVPTALGLVVVYHLPHRNMYREREIFIAIC